MIDNVVIIGGGVAAVNAVKAIREIDSDINIFIFQNEKYYPYYRIKLTKGLFDNLEEEKIMLQKKDWYESNNVKLYLNTEVVGIDTIKSEIILHDGNRFGYNKLLLANGSKNFMPSIDGINKENVYTIRKLDNIRNIQDSINDKKTILNVGGGVQGIETVWSLYRYGKDAILVEFQERLMPRQLDKRASEILKTAIEGFKTKVLLNSQIVKILGENKVKGVETKDGKTIDSDMVIFSVGIRANKELLENTEVKTNIGIVVNDRMETNVENVYAAGDVAELDGKIVGLWNIAIEQGKTAGYNIVGKHEVYVGVVPVTILNAFNIALFSMGEVDEKRCDKTIIEESTDSLSYKRLFIRDNKIIGAIVIGDNKYSTILKNAIEKKIVFSNIDLLNVGVNDLLLKLKSS
ncbi:FAD-dependent oxidoreductase [Clostridium bowmanii]|uniref:NAD(P)/FAD-dependent oxidoreductase n=1 Tax=Clostridium bowmanii TaxID=132925 RepID=UPI001C0D5E21|nr:FAD-dependent oxidoreductase [Clostridium bowmanii]MBU3188905.1 FAD-dependent oxidoreductase [Clostridium bowmanii]MCA1073689.1 FAD-dependent oxidoreductase [Clostridium bowmanii]